MDTLIFYDFTNSNSIETQYICNSNIMSYIDILHEHDLNYKELYFLHNFKIVDIYKTLEPNINIIIINKKMILNQSIKSHSDSTLNLDDKTNKYISLLQEHKDLITFIIILKTENLDYITLYLEKYRKKEIYNIIYKYQEEIIDMI